MKVLAGLILMACATGVAVLPHVASKSASPGHVRGIPSARAKTVGSVIAVHRIPGRTTISVRTASDQVLELSLGKPVQLRTYDGQVLAVSSIRSGDTIAIGKGRLVEDASQRSVKLNGTVGEAPYPAGNSMVVQVASAQGIVVDIAHGTQLVGSSGHVSASTVFEDADQVSIRGILDDALGEMTQTSAITWLGPRVSPPGSHGQT